MTDVQTKKKYIPTKELIFYLMGTFFLTNMQGMLGNYRQAYLVKVLFLSEDKVSLINFICNIAGFAISFFLTIIIDRAPKPGKNKFKPLVYKFAIPVAVMSVLLFYTPSAISHEGMLIVIYLVGIQCVYNIANGFANTLNSAAVVMSPDSSERDTVLTWRGIVNAIGNSAPLVVVLVAGIFIKKESALYLFCSLLCALVAVVFMLIASKNIKERIVYSSTRVNPIAGYRDVLKNKYAWIVIFSEFLKNFRGVATYMGIFLAASLLGSTSKYLFLGLPTGIGTFVGMLIVKALLKKFNSKQIYICSGIYSLFVNIIAFVIGYQYFNSGSSALQILFIVSLFLVGLQFGASNLLPAMFQADILEDIEVKTHKRLDASLAFICTIGSTISGAIASAVAPQLLYGQNSVIQYIPSGNDDNTEQTLRTKIMLLFFYTVIHGIMMLLAGLPYLFYKLTGERKENVHQAVLVYREQIEQTAGGITEE